MAINDALPLKAARRDGIANLKSSWAPNTNDGTGQMPFLPPKWTQLPKFHILIPNVWRETNFDSIV